jgi:O-antigen/teichoic acid export membrane protein
MKFFRNLAGVLLTSAVSVPIGLLSSILLARYLSTDDRGLYALALSFAAIMTMVVQLGWPTASIYRLRSARRAAAEVSGAALVFLGAVSCLTILVCIPIEPILRDRFLSGLPRIVFYLALASIPFRVLANGFGAIARGIDRFRYENWYAVALQVGNVGAVVVVLLWLGGALEELMWAGTVVYVVLVVGLIAVVVRETGISFALQRGEMRRSFRFGLKTYAMTLTGRVHERVDIFMLAYLVSDPSQVAFYAIAKGGIQQLQLLPNSLGKVAYPQLAGLGPEDAARFACTLVRQSVLLMLPASVVLFVAAPVLLPFVYGEPYAASTLPFMLMVPGVLLLGVDRILTRFFTGTNQQTPNVVTRALSLTVNVVLNLVWIPAYGITGAAAATSISTAASVVWMYVLARHRLGIDTFVFARR